MSRLTPVVLFVDDHEDTRHLYELALSLHGFRTVAAATVEEAVHAIADLDPDVIVTDLSLEGPGDGYELIHQRAGRPVIVLTAWADADHLARAREAGCAAVLVKPCVPGDVVAIIRSLLASP
jgi:DNA-binding response OmpR family regulator